MWSRLYRKHVIMAFPTYDTVANAWAPQADINWFAGTSHDSKFVKFSKRCTTEEEAVTWVVQRLGEFDELRIMRSPREPVDIGLRCPGIRNGIVGREGGNPHTCWYRRLHMVLTPLWDGDFSFSAVAISRSR